MLSISSSDTSSKCSISRSLTVGANRTRRDDGVPLDRIVARLLLVLGVFESSSLSKAVLMVLVMRDGKAWAGMISSSLGDVAFVDSERANGSCY